MRRHAPVAWNGQHLLDMFHFRGLGILLHLVAAWSQIDDGAVFFEVDASPVPDRDILARCKGTLTSDAHAPVLHGEETCIDCNDHISGVASLASTRSVQLGHVAVRRSTVSAGHSPWSRMGWYSSGLGGRSSIMARPPGCKGSWEPLK